MTGIRSRDGDRLHIIVLEPLREMSDERDVLMPGNKAIQSDRLPPDLIVVTTENEGFERAKEAPSRLSGP